MAEQTIWDDPTVEQRELLRGVYEMWSPQGVWCSVRDLSRWLRLNAGIRTGARDIMDTFPVVGRRRRGPSYSAIWFDSHDFSDSAAVRLTPAAGLLLLDFRPLADVFVQVIRLAAERVVQAAPGAGPAKLSSDELEHVVDERYRLFIPCISDMMEHEPISLYQLISRPSRGNLENPKQGVWQWKADLGETLAEYEDVASLEAYVSKTVELLMPELPSANDTNDAGVEAQSAQHAAPPFYVNPLLLDELDALPDTTWNLHKLRTVLRELNDNYARGNAYACLALFRTLLDVVPPLFDAATFSAVVNNAAGLNASDKRYMKLLGEKRLAADSVLHRQIGRNRDLVDMHYLPPNDAMDAFIRVAIDRIVVGS